MSNYISEAFQALNLMESEQFTFDKKGSLQLGNFLEDDTFDDFETVIDPEAHDEEEIKDSYIDMVILGCDVCHSMIYKNQDEVEVDEELNLANVGECCPYCYTADGFKIIGKVAPYVEIDVESNEDVEVEVDGKTIKSKPTGSEEVVDEEDDKSSAETLDEWYEDVQYEKSDFEVYYFGQDETLYEQCDEEELDFDDYKVEWYKKPGYYYVTAYGDVYIDNEYVSSKADFEEMCYGLTESIHNSKSKNVAKKYRDLVDEEIAPEQKYPIKSPNGITESVGKIDRNAIKAKFAKAREGACDEEIEPEQKYPVQSPIAEAKQDKKILKKRQHMKYGANEEIEACQKYPVESPIGEEVTPDQKYPVKSPVGTKGLKEGMEDSELSNLGYKIVPVRKGDEAVLALMDTSTSKRVAVPADLDLCDRQAVIDYIKTNLKSPVQESLTEGMEDISITTDDTVIKVKATPRVDKETIVPPTEEEIAEVEEPVADVVEEPTEEVAGEVTEEPVAEGEEGIVDVDVEEVDETSFDELGESYLKKVYDNVAGYKTQDAKLRGNQLIMEGVIEFTSGKKAITEFKFEAVDMYKDGKVRLVGLNENLSRNKKAFTLRGAMNGNKLMIETFNYNYSAKDIKTGKSKRLYGTVSKGN